MNEIKKYQSGASCAPKEDMESTMTDLQQRKGTSEHPFSVQEFQELSSLGQFPGGYVENLGLCNSSTHEKGLYSSADYSDDDMASSSEEEVEPTGTLLAGHGVFRPNGLPVTMQVKVSWGSGSFLGQPKPDVSAEFEKNCEHYEYTVDEEKSFISAEWQTDYIVKITGEFRYTNIGNDVIIDGVKVVYLPTIIPIFTHYYIPYPYRK